MLTKNKGVFAIFILLAAFVGFYFYKKYKVAPNILTSRLELQERPDKTFSMSQLDGKAYILTFYASWCKDCIKEMPGINDAVNNELKHLPVYAITDESFEKLEDFRSNHNYSFIFLKLNKAFKAYDINAIPTTYIFGKNGEVIFNHVGYVDWSDKSFIEHIKLSTL
jgi:peroxiredoxin